MEFHIFISFFRRRKRTPKAEKPEEGGADSDAGGASPKKIHQPQTRAETRTQTRTAGQVGGVHA